MTKEIPNKSKVLKSMIQSKELAFLMEAHNGLSAKIAEEAGFEGIWGSGLSISAALGVRDNNEASWTQVLEVLEFMADATRIPILLDGDTGYGNFNSMQRLVRKLEQRGVAGVCIEDKLFPKTNSFIKGHAQPLAEMDEFAGKIKAGKDAQRNDDFVIVARVEAFIAGWGLEEALKRGEAYRQAGADAILIHSALSNPSEILAFKKEWADRLPVVIVPTKYYTTPTDVFRDAGFSVVIWANHLMRSAMTAMRKTAQNIYKNQNLLSVEDEVVTVSEVFKIQGEEELSQNEKKYLPTANKNVTAIVLAASRGAELGDLTLEKPKAMVEIAGKPLLAHISEAYRASGVKDIKVVRGYKKEAVSLTSFTYIDNDDFAHTQEVYSLDLALTAHLKKSKIEESTLLISYGDVLFKKYILQELLDAEADFVVMVDSEWKESRNLGRFADFVECSEGCSKTSFYSKVELKSFTHDPDKTPIHGEWMGFLKVSPNGLQILSKELNELKTQNADVFQKLKIPDVLGTLIQKGHSIRVIYTTGHWLDVDSVDDVIRGSSF